MTKKQLEQKLLLYKIKLAVSTIRSHEYEMRFKVCWDELKERVEALEKLKKVL